jgi:hypothetical protein
VLLVVELVDVVLLVVEDVEVVLLVVELVVAANATIVVVVVATAIVVEVVVVAVTAFVVVDSHSVLTEGANPMLPSNTSGTKTTDKRVDERITHRVVKIPTASSTMATSANLTELPVVGKAHTSTANILTSNI